MAGLTRPSEKTTATQSPATTSDVATTEPDELFTFTRPYDGNDTTTDYDDTGSGENDDASLSAGGLFTNRIRIMLHATDCLNTRV